MNRSNAVRRSKPISCTVRLPAQTPHGRRLLPRALDEIARSNPNRLYAVIPHGFDLSQGFRDITFREMASGINFVAHWIYNTFGCSSNFETLCYIGIPDLRSVVLFLAGVKCGYKIFLPSPRDPVATNLSLLEQTACSKILYSKEVVPIVAQLQAGRHYLDSVEIHTFDEMLMGSTDPYPYKYTFEEAVHDPVAILCSPKPTGPPKLVTMTHGSFAVLDNERYLAATSGHNKHDFSIWDFSGGGRFYLGFPYFHISGFLSVVVNPIFTEASSPVLGPPLIPPSGHLLKEIIKAQFIRALYVPTLIAEQLLQEPGGIDFFRGLDLLCYADGPFSNPAEKRLAEVTELCHLYSTPETFHVPQLAPKSEEDRAYTEWNPSIPLEMQPHEEGTYELVLFTDPSTEFISALNHNLPGIAKWRTKQLFIPHPFKSKLWRFHGLRDDTILLSTGEKFDPTPLETMIQSHNLLCGALVTGSGRPQTALIIEQKPSTEIQESWVSLSGIIWPLVEQANLLLPPGSGARIVRSKILVTSDMEKPFIRARKGNVVRKLNEKRYERELDSLFLVGGSKHSQVTVPNRSAKYFGNFF